MAIPCVRHGKCSQLQWWAAFLAPVLNKHGLQSGVQRHRRKSLGPNHTAMSLQSEHKTDITSFWLMTLLTPASSSLLALETTHPSTVVSASVSTVNFNAITAWGWTTLLHCKEGLILSIWVDRWTELDHSCFNELITAILPVEQYRSIHMLLYLW